MIAPDLFAQRVMRKILRLHAELCGDELAHQGNDFPWHQQAARVAEGAQLQGEPEPVRRFPPRSNMLDIIIGKRVVLKE